MNKFKLLISLFTMLNSSSLLMGQTGFMQTSPATGTDSWTARPVVAAPANVPPAGYAIPVRMERLALASVGILGMFSASRRGRNLTVEVLRAKLVIGSLVLLILWILFAVSRGHSSSDGSITPASSTVTPMLTGTSGSISHTTPITRTLR
jgi:hypothetical protein